MGCLRKKQVLFLIILAGMMLFAIPAFAQDEVRYYKPITEINLGVKELTLYVGEQYTFPMTYEPAETPAVFLDWYMDESTIQLDRETFTITAIAPGEARLMVESNMGFTFDYCDITVLGSQGKELVEKKAGTELIRLSEKDREKITAKSLMNFLEFVENSSFTPEAYAAVSERVFNVTAQVRPGSVSVESQRAAALGMEKALELPDLDAVSLRGTMSQILAFVSDNEDLHVLFEFEPFYIDDPAPDYNSDSAAKAMNLKDNVEAYTTVSKAHNLGYKGTGAVVAIIDTGFDKNHEQFSGRVIAEDCFASASGNYYPVCVSGSAAPSNSVSPSLHNHGSHVAGIAAGRDGIAPNAKLIGVGTAIEYCPTTDSCVDNMNFSLYEIAQYLVDLQRQYKSAGSAPIVAVNMSFGSTLESSVCDSKYESIYTRAFNLFVENNIIPVKSAGNSGADGSVSAPGCISSSFTVGALYDNSTPQIAPYSNHSETLVDILAPGTKIWSAFYAYDNSDYNWYTQSSCTNVSTNKNCYGYEGGTSMAAPMVTGAFAVLKQRYPNLTASQLEAQMIAMSTKTANYRLAGSEWSSNLTNPAKTFSYSKPILDFSRIDENPLISTDLTCGMNVKYVISGSTITFSKVNTSSAAVFGSDCVNAFKNNSGIKTVKINSAMSISSGSEFFSGCNYVTSMDLSKLNVSGVTSMYQMFYSCGSLTTLNVSGWNTSGVTTTKEMFMNCSSLKSLDLSSWNVSNVIEMWNMFYECSSLASLNVSSWNTSKVQDMDGLFYECSSLTSLDLSGWNTSSVEYKTYTFGYCDKLKTLSLGKNTLAVNIFEDLPAYNDIWYYVQKGSAAGSPVAVGTAKKDASLFTSYNYNTMAGTWSTTKPSELSTLTISQGSVLGYANGIEVKTAYDANATGYKISVYDVANKKTITPTIDKPVKSGSNVTIKIHGSSLVNGNIYKLTVYKYNTTNGKTTKSNTVTMYGMPHSVISKLTAQPISNGVRLDSEFKTGVDGTRYYVYDADTNKQVKK
ncbi:MAG: S8 family serine peptidase, partial [Anaerolineaceae bacterium]|nr:S8 family serine peptidase [Anaerolineaceae bacterium]